MKNKLYDFFQELPNLPYFLFNAWWILGLSVLIFDSYILCGAWAVFMLFCFVLMIFVGTESGSRARQRLQDQHDSASPHWDGQVRFPLDIEPRLELLRARMKKDREEMLCLRLQIAESDQTTDS